MEYVDIFDENNEKVIDVIDRKTAHDKNLWHRHISAWVMNEKGEILLEKRAHEKKKNPDKWAKVGGHIDSGETPLQAVKRETKEEIGIDVKDSEITVLDIFKSPFENEKYFTYNYLFRVNYKIEDYKLQKEEVAEVKYYTIEELEKIKAEHNSNYTFNYWSDEDFKNTIELLKKFRDKK